MTGSVRPEFGSYKYWGNLMDSQGYASFFARDNRSKQMVKLSTGEFWSKAVSEEFNLHITNLRSNPNDPPDLLGEIESVEAKVELVEFLDEKLRADFNKARAQDQSVSTLHGEYFERNFWTMERFHDTLRQLIDKKNTKLKRQNRRVDFLVIHSDVETLCARQVNEWLNCFKHRFYPFLDHIHFLLTYQPGWRDHWPVFVVPQMMEDPL